MIDIPVEDFVFVVCALIGDGLLLVTVVLRDQLDQRYGELPIGELIDRYGGGTQPPA